MLAACRPSPQQIAEGDDPLAALTVPVESHRYNSGYWREQARIDSPGRWAKAVAYCGGTTPRPGLEADGAKPNCIAVRDAATAVENERSRRALLARLQAQEAAAVRLHERFVHATPAERQALVDSVTRASQF